MFAIRVNRRLLRNRLAQGRRAMVMGYLLSGIGGGLVAAGSALALGHPVLMVVMLYSVFGILAMAGFGLVADRRTARD